MKKNNKGFILLETLVVSTFIISTLVFLYVQFINLKKNYDTSFRYNTIPGLYKAKTIDKFIKENYGYGKFIDDISSSKNEFIEIYNSDDKCNFNYFSNNISFCESLHEKLEIKTVLISSNNINKLKEYLKDNNKYSNELYLYIKNETIKNDNTYSLIVEYNDNSFASLDIGISN